MSAPQEVSLQISGSSLYPSLPSSSEKQPLTQTDQKVSNTVKKNLKCCVVGLGLLSMADGLRRLIIPSSIGDVVLGSFEFTFLGLGAFGCGMCSLECETR